MPPGNALAKKLNDPQSDCIWFKEVFLIEEMLLVKYEAMIISEFEWKQFM